MLKRARGRKREGVCEREGETSGAWLIYLIPRAISNIQTTGLTIDIVKLAPIIVNIYAALMDLKAVDN